MPTSNLGWAARFGVPRARGGLKPRTDEDPRETPSPLKSSAGMSVSPATRMRSWTAFEPAAAHALAPGNGSGAQPVGRRPARASLWMANRDPGPEGPDDGGSSETGSFPMSPTAMASSLGVGPDRHDPVLGDADEDEARGRRATRCSERLGPSGNERPSVCRPVPVAPLPRARS